MSSARKSVAQRCAWSPAVEKCREEFRFVIMYKDARGNIVPFSKSIRSQSVKIPWGPPDSCSAGSDEQERGTETFLRFGLVTGFMLRNTL